MKVLSSIINFHSFYKVCHTDYYDITMNCWPLHPSSYPIFNHLLNGRDEGLLTFPDRSLLCLQTGWTNFHGGINIWPLMALYYSKICLEFLCTVTKLCTAFMHLFFAFIIDEAGTLESQTSRFTSQVWSYQIANLSKSPLISVSSPIKEELFLPQQNLIRIAWVNFWEVINIMSSKYIIMLSSVLSICLST